MVPDIEDIWQTRESDREYLCQGFLHTLSLALIIGGWGWGVVLIIADISLFSSFHWLSPFMLILFGSLSNHWYETRRPLASAAALMGLWAAPLLAAYASMSPLFLFALNLAIIIAGILASPPILGTISLLSIAMVIGGYVMLGWSMAPAMLAALVLSMAISMGLSWMLWHYIYVALELSWESRRRAVEAMRAAQARRAELRRAVKALDEGYERLQRLNQELIETRHEAEEARRLKAEFAANVSHELRTPINLIVGFSEMMYMSPESYGGQPLPAEYLGDVHAIYRSARHLQTLIDDILDLSRIDARQMALTREMGAIEDVIAEAVQVIRELVQRKGLSLEVDVSADLPPIYLDRTRIRQVLLNLISNAVRFTDQGYIRVKCRLLDTTSGEAEEIVGSHAPALPEGRFICLSVADSGIGIRSEDLGKVFEEFRQVDGSSRRRYGGTGLGLAISKRFVELHGGWMWVESEYGRGSTFYFVLPAAEEAWLRPKLLGSPHEPTLNAPGKRIVVLDRDPAVVQLFARYLRRRQVEGATSVEQMLNITAAYAPELLVLADGTPPEAVLSRQKDYPALASARLCVLSCPIPTERRKALSLGFADYLLKPIGEQQLRAALEGAAPEAQRALIIEDDPDMIRLLGRMLARIRPEMTAARAYSGEEAQQIILAGASNGQMPDVVLLDLALPGLSGYDLMLWMQDRGLLTMPIIAITANVRLQASTSSDVMTMTLARRSGFSAQEALTFTELVAEHFPCRYAFEDSSMREANRSNDRS
ncbi:MAG: response regulator [Chloroflexi bacterium]|nr:response regulator [Chloroflexota bacterium]